MKSNKTKFRETILVIICLFCVVLLNNKVNAQNMVTTLCGTGSEGFVNGDTSEASFKQPFGICIDQSGNLYLADMGNHCIRKISVDGQVTTYAGTGVAGFMDGPAAEAKFNSPTNLMIDEQGVMYVSDFVNQRIRKITPDGMVSTIAGTATAGYLDGPALEAKFNYPRGICMDTEGNLYIGDSWNHRIRKISTDGMVSTYAGGGDVIGVQSVGSYIDAADTAARFYTPCEVSIDQYNNLYVADAYNHRIRKIDSVQIVTTIAGSSGFGPDGGGFQNGNGEEAMFDTPTANYVALDGKIYVGDGANQRVRIISPDGLVSTYAGTETGGFQNGVDSLALFDFPRGCVMDYDRLRLYVVDYNNHAIRIIHIAQYVGLSKQTGIGGVKIFPNPSNGEVNIVWDKKFSSADIRIINSIGQELYHKSLSNPDENKLSIDKLSSGIYYFNVILNKKISQTGKFIVIDK